MFLCLLLVHLIGNYENKRNVILENGILKASLNAMNYSGLLTYKSYQQCPSYPTAPALKTSFYLGPLLCLS
jgi:hypothetical protein